MRYNTLALLFIFPLCFLITAAVSIISHPCSPHSMYLVCWKRWGVHLFCMLGFLLPSAITIPHSNTGTKVVQLEKAFTGQAGPVCERENLISPFISLSAVTEKALFIDGWKVCINCNTWGNKCTHLLGKKPVCQFKLLSPSGEFSPTHDWMEQIKQIKEQNKLPVNFVWRWK